MAGSTVQSERKALPRQPPHNETKSLDKAVALRSITKHDAKILASVRKNAHRLDRGLFSCCGLRFGWESVIGLLPGVGDLIGLILALLLIKKANTVDGGLPLLLRCEMVMWVVIDATIGLVPCVGDVLDAWVKCNVKNCDLLEQHLGRKYGRAVEQEV